MLNQERFQSIVQAYKHDQESVYQTWFIDNAQRLKAFRAIRHGVEQVIKDVKSGSFGNDFKGSSLEVVVSCGIIWQVFCGIKWQTFCGIICQ